MVITTQIPIWIDCDPGHDDAMAIMLAAYSPHIKLLGISTVSGNQSVDKTTNNAARVLKSAGVRGVRVVRGAGKPLMCLPRHDPEIHGESGLGGTDLLPPVDADDDILFYPAGAKAIAVMAETILSNPDPVCLVVIGPMTNVALLLSVYPEVVPRIRSLAFMGGTLKGGNRSPVAEFNILCDPEAAQIVLTSGIKEIAMIPLDVTHMTLTTKQVLETLEQKIKPINPRFYQMLRELLCFFNQTYCEVFGFKEGSPLHDPNAVAYLIDPTIYDRKLMRVDVECASTLCYGQTICDIWEQSPLPKNCWVTTSVDVDKFWELMMDAWKQAAKASPL